VSISRVAIHPAIRSVLVAVEAHVHLAVHEHGWVEVGAVLCILASLRALLIVLVLVIGVLVFVLAFVPRRILLEVLSTVALTGVIITIQP